MDSPRRIIGTVMALTMLAFAGDVAAQMEVEISPFAGGTFYLSDPPDQFLIHREGLDDLTIENGSFADVFTLGLTLGLQFNENLALEGMFSWVPTELRYGSVTQDVNTFMYAGSFVVTFPSNGRLDPFIGLGIGGETVNYDDGAWESHTDFMGNVLAGVKIRMNDRTAIRLEARDCLTLFGSDIDDIDDALQNDLMLTAGVSFGLPLR